MIGAIVGELGGAVVLTVVAPALLTRLPVLRAAPRTGLTVWLGLSLTVTIALLLAGPVALLSGPHQAESGPGGLLAFMQRCASAVHDQPLAVLLPAAISALVAIRLLGAGFAVVRRTRGITRRHREAAELVGRRDASTGAIMIDYAAPLGYCLPGRPRHIVVSTGTAELLDAPQFAAVVDHERAHLAGGHHYLLGIAGVLHAALPFLPLMRTAHEQVALLVERAADERAGRRHGRLVVAEALLRLATARSAPPGPAAGLAATGGNVVTRMSYLLEPPSTASVLRSAVSGAVLAATESACSA